MNLLLKILNEMAGYYPENTIKKLQFNENVLKDKNKKLTQNEFLLRKEISQKELEITTLSERVEKFKQNEKSLKEEIHQSDLKLAVLKESIKENQNIIETYRYQFLSKNREIERLSQVKTNLEQTLKYIKEVESEQEKNTRNIENELEIKEKHISILENMIEKLSSEIKILKQEARTTTNIRNSSESRENKTLKERNQYLEKEINSKNNKIEYLKTVCNANKNESKNSLDVQQQNKIIGLKNELEIKEKHIFILENMIEKLSSEIKTLKQETRATDNIGNNPLCDKKEQNTIKGLKNEIEILQNQITFLQKKVATREGQAEDIESSNSGDELRELERQRQKLEEKIFDKNKEIKILQSEQGETKEQIKKLSNMFHALKRAKGDDENNILQLKAYIDKLSQENENLKRQLSEIDNEQISSGNEINNENENDNDNLPTYPIFPTSDLSTRSYTFTFGTNDKGTESHIDVPFKARTTGNSSKRSKEEEVLEKSGSSIVDFPPITNDSNKTTVRSIRYVFDEKTKEKINADEFFNRTAEEIAQVSRTLAESDMNGSIHWTCGCCRKRVKIGHRTINNKESLFFFHAVKNNNCPWTPQATSSNDRKKTEDLLVADENQKGQTDLTISDKDKNKAYKELLIKLLTSSNSERMGISNVKMDPVIISNFPYMKWRRPDISFNFKGRKVVFIIQKLSHNIDQLVERDIFFRLNDIHILWIFTNDNNSSYEFMRKSDYKNTMFDNHRNVFVFDKEAQKESQIADCVLLKCNWLDDDDLWHIRLENSSSNGKLVKIEELSFDDEYCKPYYFNANESYFKKYPEAHNLYLRTRQSRAQLMKEIEENWTRDPNYENAQSQMRQFSQTAIPFQKDSLWGFRFNTTILINPIFTAEPKRLANDYWLVQKDNFIGIVNSYGQKEIDWNVMLNFDEIAYDEKNNHILFSRANNWGVTDEYGKELIRAQYQSILPWNKNIYRIKLNNRWGLMNTSGKIIRDCIYDNIGILINNRAKATLSNSKDFPWKTFDGFIDGEGNVIKTSCNKQKDGLYIIETFGLLGVIDQNNKTLISCEYQDIKYWEYNLYKVCIKGKWGIWDISKSTLIVPIKYNLIGELIDGRAKTLLHGIEGAIDRTGKEVSQQTIVLQEGLQKAMFEGKWGIFDNYGNVIIPPKYDEIGSFRSRLIGVINQQIIKLDASYNYPLKLKGKYLNQDEKFIFIDVAGVKCMLSKSQLNQSPFTINDIVNNKAELMVNMSFLNLFFNKKKYFLRIISEESLSKELSHGDKDSDFRLNVILEGRITGRRHRKGITTRIRVTFKDNKHTWVSLGDFTRCKKNMSSYSLNDNIRLKKIGFNDELDLTNWDILS